MHRPDPAGDARRAPRPRWFAVVVAGHLLLAAGAAAPGEAPDGAIRAGLGAYYTKARGPLGPDERPPVAEYRSGAALRKAAPTNQWYSSIVFERWSMPLYAQPMSYRAGENGFELGLPDRHATSPNAIQREIRYAHSAAIVVAPTGFRPQDARLTEFSDWQVQLRLGSSDGHWLSATILHGSPFSYYECDQGDVRFTFAAQPEPIPAGADSRVVASVVAGHAYAIFGPSGGTWTWTSATELVLHLPAHARYFSVAGLPDQAPATVRDFLKVAYAFPTRTRATWHYDEQASSVTTLYRVQTTAREGRNRTTLMGLYPHQWSAVTPRPASAYHYDTLRGPIRLISANQFTVTRHFNGILPTWPALESAQHRAAVDRTLAADAAAPETIYAHQLGQGTYWIGKALGANAQLLSVAEAAGRNADRERLLAELKRRLESSFDGRHETYFVHDRTLGTFVGLPQEYHSYQSMNDHHFHYGYWLMGAAHVALRDPAWAAPERWGGMVGKLVADIATVERDGADFPFLRNFDTYEGHSWASGTSTGGAGFDSGNNQESSSEAVNAWAALVLWGEATGNRALRDLGVYLYTTEIAAVQQYWFDLEHQVLGADFGKPFAVQVFGGKFAYNTWWTEEPHQMFGINALPFTPASTYLGADSGFVRSVFAALPAEEQRYGERAAKSSHGPPDDIWQDALAAWLALADANAALARWNPQGSVERGETRAHTLYWLLSLSELGTPDFSVSADTALYAVFKDARGQRTYLAYNARDTRRSVRFSDGRTLEVAPRSLARAR